MSLIRNILTFFFSFIVAIVIIEIVLSFLPVNSVTRTKNLDINSHPLDVSAKDNSLLSFSRKYNFLNTIYRKTNNLGFFSDTDYVDGEKIIGVIGDSYVEAVQVNYEDSFHGMISKKINIPVYNFAISGAPLSQYEAYLNEACTRYNIEKLIINIVANDFDESIFENRVRDGFFHYYDNGTKLSPTPYVLSPLRQFANKSNLIRYIYFNLGYAERIIMFLNNFFDFNRNYRESGTYSDIQNYSSHYLAIDSFLSRIDDYCLSSENILFIVDGHRPELYNFADNWELFNYFIESSKFKEFKVLDMHNYFQNDFKDNQKNFEFEFDKHWNKYGHLVVSEAIIKSGFLKIYTD